MSGQFINFFLKFKSPSSPDGLDNLAQAQAILSKARTLIDTGQTGVAITYSANEGQTKDLEKAYASGEFSGNISGDNQAKVMRAMETALGNPAWSDLQLKLRIAPITTIPYGSDPLKIVQEDLARIKAYLQSGWAILGWQNQGTVGDAGHPYAIGGGVVAKLDPKIDTLIQTTLMQFAKDYPES